MAERSEQPDTPIRVLLVDTEPVVLEGLKVRINDQADMTVVGSCDNATDAARLLEEQNPDIVVTDLQLPGLAEGLPLLEKIDETDGTQAVVFTHCDEASYAPRTLRSGCRGYVMKNQPLDVLLEAIRRVVNGDLYFSERMARRLLGRVVGASVTDDLNPVDVLSQRQLQVFELIGRCWSTARIAERLELSAKTVNVHRARIKEKLKLRDSNELTRSAVEWMQRRRQSYERNPKV